MTNRFITDKHFRYYRLYTDGFWCEAFNPRWNDLQRYGWGLRFIRLRGSPERRRQALEALAYHYDWDESLLPGTTLRVVPFHTLEQAPDAGEVHNTVNLVQVVSPRVIAVLSQLSLPNALEWEPYPLYSADGRLLGKYYCLRYLVELECVDSERSYRIDDPYPYARSRMVLRREAIGDHRMFVTLDLDFDGFEIVRSDVKTALERAGVLGLEFEEVEVV